MTRQGCLAPLTILVACAAATAQSTNGPASQGNPYASPGFSTTLPASQSGIPPKTALSPYASNGSVCTSPYAGAPAPEAPNGLACDAYIPGGFREEPRAPAGRWWASGEYFLWWIRDS